MNILPSFIRRRLVHRPSLLQILENIGWLFFDKALRMGVGLLLSIWLARYLGPEQLGQLTYTTAFVGLFTALATLGLQGVVVRDLVQTPQGREQTLGSAAILIMMGGTVAYLALVATVFGLRESGDPIRTLVLIVGSTLLFKVSDVALYWFESQVKSRYVVWTMNGTFLLFAALKVGMILTAQPLLAFAWAIAAEAALTAVLLIIVLNRRGVEVSTFAPTFDRVKGLLEDSWPLMLSGVAISIYLKIDQVMLGHLLGDESVGIYSVAVNISEVWYFAPMVIAASVFPAILEAKKRSEAEYYSRLQKLFNLMVWVSVAIALPMTFASPYVINILYGDAYSEAGLVLSIHIWASVFVFLGVASGRWLLAEGYMYFSLERAILGATSNIVLNLVLIPTFNIVGAATATVISYSLSSFFYDIVRNETRRIFFMKSCAVFPRMGRKPW